MGKCHAVFIIHTSLIILIRARDLAIIQVHIQAQVHIQVLHTIIM
jgi:hypothetical protein